MFPENQEVKMMFGGATRADLDVIQNMETALSRDFFKDRYLSLLSLVDGVKGTIEIYKPQSPSQVVWRENWLEKARELLGEHDKHICEKIRADQKAQSKIKKESKKTRFSKNWTKEDQKLSEHLEGYDEEFD